MRLTEKTSHRKYAICPRCNCVGTIDERTKDFEYYFLVCQNDGVVKLSFFEMIAAVISESNKNVYREIEENNEKGISQQTR